ncbi:Winged helix DNA-binding domain-containing protein [Mycena indigotica]|uniref:Winged helix DNA-binding domain-containing protein n=1 Tax=Mycena indigotica TaxID=2126181 RepID=A0A8H6T6E9_9AGAR|nr:Winged helix DNA-binding domain-containing protein [Mycena indigotica]KAF7311918.1 Winged helix DNA-binding domain-containing protein [Mycena indigotica]
MADPVFAASFYANASPTLTRSRTATVWSGPVQLYHAAEDTPGGTGQGAGAGGGGGPGGHTGHGHHSQGGGQRERPQRRYTDDAPYVPPRNRDYAEGYPQHAFYHHSQHQHQLPAGSPLPPYSPSSHPHPSQSQARQSSFPMQQGGSRRAGTAPELTRAPARSQSSPSMPTALPPAAFHQPVEPFAQSPPVPMPGPDPAPILRRKLNLPENVPITLSALPDYAADTRPSVPLPLLVQVAIYESETKRLTLREIYSAIEGRYEFFRAGPSNAAWKRSIRHALSLHLVFRHLDRPVQESGKGGYWTLDYSRGEGTKRQRKRRPGEEEDGSDGEVETGETDVESASGSEYEQQQYEPQRYQHHQELSQPPVYRGYIQEPLAHPQAQHAHHLYVDTVARIKQEPSPSPTPSPGSQSSRSSDGFGAPSQGPLYHRGYHQPAPANLYGPPSHPPPSQSNAYPAGYQETRRTLAHSRSWTPQEFQQGSSRDMHSRPGGAGNAARGQHQQQLVDPRLLRAPYSTQFGQPYGHGRGTPPSGEEEDKQWHYQSQGGGGQS